MSSFAVERRDAAICRESLVDIGHERAQQATRQGRWGRDCGACVNRYDYLARTSPPIPDAAMQEAHWPQQHRPQARIETAIYRVCCKRSFHDLLAGRGALACDRLDRRGRYPEGCIQARRSGSAPQRERSRTIVAASRGSRPQSPRSQQPWPIRRGPRSLDPSPRPILDGRCHPI